MTAATNAQPTVVDFHFDVMCPWAYQTSLWMREVRDRLGLTVNWRFFSLEEVNRREGKKHPWEREWSYGWSMMRIGALLRRTDMAHLDAWYAATGRALHVEGNKPHEPAVARHLLTTIGLDPDLVESAIADPTTHDEVRAEHDKVVAAGGFGVPTLFFPATGAGAGTDEACLFGPVVIDPPTGEAAVRLWDVVCGWLEFPHLYEIQRPKGAADQRLIARTFRPYLEARDWVSINRGEVVSFER
jgi:2-hydroxychromene-2-carboxylate isomerase